MDILPPLALAIPLLVSAALMAASPLLSRRAADVTGIATSLAAMAICGLLLWRSAGELTVHWAGGWMPENGVAVGIDLAVDPFGAGLALFVALLTTASLIFSWHYFESAGALFHVIMLIFAGAMIGFCLSGDLFTLFVFFELMSVTAYGLTAYKVEKSPLAGSLNFAVVNSLGAFLLLIGIALLYGRTGALNLAQLGRAIAAGPVDALVIVAFVLITTGFFVKAALVPFHFWLADAHAVAPTPVSVLFSGVMIALGLYGAARVYWTVFSIALQPHAPELRAVLVILGAVTALFGGLMCLLQRHLKRLLAFSSISHMGALLLGIALLTPTGLAGAAIYLVGHGLVKGALFICAGMLLNSEGSVDEIELKGRGKRHPFTGVLWTVGGLALAGLPPFGTFLGKALVEESADKLGYSWIGMVLVAASILTGGAVLRASGRIFLGWGHTPSAQSQTRTERESSETDRKQGQIPRVMILPALGLLALALVWGLWPGLPASAREAAVRFADQAGYATAVLGEPPPPRLVAAAPEAFVHLKSVLLSLASAAGAVLLALLALRTNLSARNKGMAAKGTRMLRHLHSGHVGDYVSWFVFGTAAYGVALMLLFR